MSKNDTILNNKEKDIINWHYSLDQYDYSPNENRTKLRYRKDGRIVLEYVGANAKGMLIGTDKYMGEIEVFINVIVDEEEFSQYEKRDLIIFSAYEILKKKRKTVKKVLLTELLDSFGVKRGSVSRLIEIEENLYIIERVI